MAGRPSKGVQGWAAYDAAQLANVDHYTAHLRMGPFEKYTVRCVTVEEAFAAAARLNAEKAMYGRRALVYAVTRDGNTIHIPAPKSQDR